MDYLGLNELGSACRNADHADHAGLTVTGDQTGELKIVAAVAAPKQTITLASVDMHPRANLTITAVCACGRAFSAGQGQAGLA